MSDDVAIVQLSAIANALAQAQSIGQVIDFKNQAEAARQCFRLAGYGLEMQNDAAEARLRAERRAGELLTGMEKAKGGRPAENRSHGATGLPPTYSDRGIDKMRAHRAMQEWEVPPECFERYVAETKASDEELTTVGLLRIAKRLRQAGEREQTAENVLDFDAELGPYRTIVIDPPWPVQKVLRDVRPNQDVMPCRTTSVEEIGKVPVARLARADL